MPNPNTGVIEGVHNHRPVSDTLATSGQPTVQQLHGIAAAGFTKVINLALHDDPRYSLPDEAGTVTGLGMKYVHIPVQFAAPTHEDLVAFFEAMDDSAQDRLWVHCAANMRVTAFLGLYRVLRQGWPEAQAFELMRSVMQPNETWTKFIATQLKSQLKSQLKPHGGSRMHVPGVEHG